MRILRRNTGQFVPISAMVMFTMVIFMVAMVNVYKVTRAKLKVQNMADAAALNLAGQQAQSYNVVVDRNEWMNHMIKGVPSPNDPNAPATIADCSMFDDAHKILIPGISCVENTGGTGNTGDLQKQKDKVFSRHIFHSGKGANGKGGAYNYAALIQTINQAQMLFVQAYNSFLGATGGTTSGTATAAPTNFIGLLQNDIPELKNDPTLYLTAWNTNNNEPTLQQVQEDAKQQTGNSTDATMTAKMEPLKFKVDHDIQTRWYASKCAPPGPPLFGKCFEDQAIEGGTLGDVFYGSGSHPPIGWLVPDTKESPQINVTKSNGSRNEVGVGVFITKTVKLPIIGTVPVTARSKAYLVSSSGQTGDSNSQQGGIPRFAPTYWVKLAN